jgi:hypothetical protein
VGSGGERVKNAGEETKKCLAVKKNKKNLKKLKKVEKTRSKQLDLNSVS